MSFLYFFKNLSQRVKGESIENLISSGSPRRDYFLMTALSMIMATLGLLLNNAAVIIGSMLIAPLLYPLLNISLGIVITDGKLLWRSLTTVLKSTFLGVGCSVVITLFFGNNLNGLTPEIILRINPGVDYFIIALVAGCAASVALIKPEHNERLPGIAISVALIPPIAVMGIGLALLNWEMLTRSFVLYLLNIIGITVAGVIVFFIMELQLLKKITQKAVKKEENVLEKEKKEL